jgi:drug/metabolite transporter (DMT)-like permease
LFLGIISTGIGIFLLFEGIKQIETSKGMSLAFFKPIFATILAYFILNELPTLALLFSIILIIIAILLINRRSAIERDS